MASKTIYPILSKLCLLLIASSMSILSAQTTCDIGINTTEDMTFHKGLPAQINYQDSLFDAQSSFALSGIDEDHFNIQIEGNSTSAALVLKDFNLGIPEGAYVTGFQLILRGISYTGVAPRDNRISLMDSSGQMIGQNKAGMTTVNEPWSELEIWSYGSTYDNWESDFNADFFNDDFGVLLEFENTTEDKIDLGLDQVAVKVYYQRPMEICGHPCVTLQTTYDPEVVEYSWEIPNAVRSEVPPGLEHTVNIFAEESPYGVYHMCLNKTYSNGDIEACCRPLNYFECINGSIGDFIWYDMNGDGMQDDNEPGLDGHRVDLYTENFSIVATTMSVAGQYQFNDLKPGRYFILVETKDFIPSPMRFDDEEKNSDFQNVYMSGSSGILIVESGGQKLDVDFGLTKPVGLCGMIWHDENGDGIADANEDFVGGIEVELMDLDCNLLQSSLSDVSGEYCFNQVMPGEYLLNFKYGPEYFVSSYGPNNIIDPTTNKIEVEIMSGQVNRANDLALFKTVEIGNQVWFDESQDQIFDLAEEGLEGIEFSLRDCNGVELRRTTSDEEGEYEFGGLKPGYYSVCLEEVPANMEVRTDRVGADNCYRCFTTLSGQVRDDLDFALIAQSSNLSINIWLDSIQNEVFDLLESGVDQIEVHLLDCDGTIVQEAVTGVDGAVYFDDIEFGEYYLSIELPSIFAFSNTNIITEAFGPGTSDCIEINGSDLNLGIPVNEVIESIISFVVWKDFDENNRLDVGDEVIPDLPVALLNCDNEVLELSYTDNFGRYSFEDLPSGAYKLCLSELPDDLDPSHPLLDEDLCTACFDYTAGIIDFDYDFGFKPLEVENKITITLWEDINRNEEREGDEPLLADHLVNLFDCNTNELKRAVYSDEEGMVEFDGLPDGEYYVEVDTWIGYSFVLNGVITELFGPGTTDCLLMDGVQFVYDIGFVKDLVLGNASISGSIWEDVNRDGFIEDFEPVPQDYRVNLLDEDGIFVRSVSTDIFGWYMFAQLVEGSYYIEIELPQGFEPTVYKAGGSGSFADSEFERDQNGKSNRIDLASNEHITGYNLGYVEIQTNEVFTISGTVWEDMNGDGSIQDGEPSPSFMRVILLDDSGNQVAEATTDIFGWYRFLGIPMGNYTIEFILPPDAKPTIFQAGPNEDFDSELSSDSRSIDLEIIDRSVMALNAGYYYPVAIGGRLWLDENSNGILELDERGLGDYEIELYDNEQELVASQASSTLNNQEGYFNFIDLLPGEYYVQVLIDSEYAFTIPDAGGEDEDSDVTGAFGDGTTELITIFSGEQVDNIGLGLILVDEGTAIIGDFVWVDANANGIQDEDELGLDGISISLYNASGDLVHETISQVIEGKSGAYLFEGLQAGNYYLEFEILEGFSPSEAELGSSKEEDSDISHSNGTGTTAIFSLSEGEENLSLDAGLVPIGSNELSGFVWLDLNSDGFRDELEPLIEGIIIQAQNITFGNTPVLESVSSIDGSYYFGDLTDGEYEITAIFDETLFAPSLFKSHNDDEKDSDFRLNGKTDLIELIGGVTVTNIDLGLIDISQPLISNPIDKEKLYPNPVRGALLNFNYANSVEIEEYKIQILDMNGKIVQSIISKDKPEQNGVIQLNISDLNPGVYMLRSNMGKRTNSKKFVKI